MPADLRICIMLRLNPVQVLLIVPTLRSYTANTVFWVLIPQKNGSFHSNYHQCDLYPAIFYEHSINEIQK